MASRLPLALRTMVGIWTCQLVIGTLFISRPIKDTGRSLSIDEIKNVTSKLCPQSNKLEIKDESLLIEDLEIVNQSSNSPLIDIKINSQTIEEILKENDFNLVSAFASVKSSVFW